MSLSKPVERTVNPAKKYIQWHGDIDKGYFAYYDKEAKKDVVLKDFEFMVLDNDLFSIAGYNLPEKTAYISNEVRTNQDLIIINGYKDKKKSEFKRGTYEQLKDFVKNSRDLSYVKSIYAMTRDGELVHIKGKGSLLTSWFNDITSSSSISSHWINIKEIKEGRNGAVKFKSPVLGFGDKVSEADYKKAFELDSNVLQPYLEVYLSKNGSSLAKSDEKDEGSYSQEAPQFDNTKWREFIHPLTKNALCSYHRGDFIEIKLGLEQDGDTEHDFYDCVCRALYDYQEAEKVWKDKRARDGKLIDMSLDDLEKMLVQIDKQAPAHEAKLSIECAIEAKRAELPAAEEEEGAEIPF